MGRFALLPADPELLEAIVLAGYSIDQRQVEPAGDCYETYAMKKLGLGEQAVEDEGEEEVEKEAEDEGVDKEKMNEKRKKGNRSEALKSLVFKNHYHALGLEDVYVDATLDDVRKAYKKKTLMHHPDKHEEGGYDEVAKQQWLAVGQVYSRFKKPTRLWLILRRREGTTRPCPSMTAFQLLASTMTKSSMPSLDPVSQGTQPTVRRSLCLLSETTRRQLIKS